jgi:hypothetical protein
MSSKNSIFLIFILLFLLTGCTSYNFDSVISGTLTTSDSKDNDGYYWKDFHFIPVAGTTYTVTVTAGSNNLASHIALQESPDSTQTSQNGSGTLTFRATAATSIFIAHVSVYALPAYLPINYTIKISKSY